MRKLFLCTAGLIGLAISGAAHAAVTFTVTNGSNPYAGPDPVTFDFESPGTTPTYVGGMTQNTDTPQGALPWPDNLGTYYTVGPAPGSNPGTIDLEDFGNIWNISLIWGSVDNYNDLEFLDADENILFSFNGAEIIAAGFGNQTNPSTNPLVRFNFSGGSEADVAFMRLRSSSQAFEIDNITINAVPEPGTWALLILGFGAVGHSMRRRSQTVRVAKARLHFA